MHYEGRVFRPPSEAYSLIIQITVGCSHNQCRFCDMYKEKQFHLRSLSDILSELHEASLQYRSVKRIFLADGDALIYPFSDLKIILSRIAELFPSCERVTCYASPKSILLKTPEELNCLRALNLTMVYMGLESGNDSVLTYIHKGETRNAIITAGQKVKAAGIRLSVTAISGIGGREHWHEHAVDTATALNAMHPDYIALLTFRLEGQAPMRADVQSGKFIMLTPLEIAQETYLMLEHLDSEGSVFRSNHISNYINLSGVLNQDKDKMLHSLSHALKGDLHFKSELERHWDLNWQ